MQRGHTQARERVQQAHQDGDRGLAADLMLLVYRSDRGLAGNTLGVNLVGLQISCCWFTDLMLMVYRSHVVGCLQISCCWFTDLMLLVYRSHFVGLQI